MYGPILRRLIFPTLDRANGTSISQKVAELAKTERSSLAELRELQGRKLDRVLERARCGSAFYPAFWAGSSEGAGPTSEYAPLDGLPIVRKEDLRRAVADGRFPEPYHTGKVIRVQSSGSTGEPMTFLRSADQESWFWALRLRMWDWAGFRLGESS